MKLYDKVSWHIDDGEDENDVINRFGEIIDFLQRTQMLNDEGKEAVQIGIDAEFSLHDRMLNKEGKKFLDKYYDKALENGVLSVGKYLEEKYA